MDGAVKLAVQLYFIVVGILHLVPDRFQRVGRRVLFGDPRLRRRQRARTLLIAVCRSEYETAHLQCRPVGGDVRRRQFHQQLRVLRDDHLLEVAARSGELVQVGRSVIVIDILLPEELVHAACLRQFQLAAAHGSRHLLRFGGHVDAELGSLLGDKAVESALRRMDGHRHLALGVGDGLYQRSHALARTVGFGRSVVIVFGKGAFAGGIEFIDAQMLVHLVDVVVGVRHRDDGAVLHEQGQFPQRRVEVVEDASALIKLA